MKKEDVKIFDRLEKLLKLEHDLAMERLNYERESERRKHDMIKERERIKNAEFRKNLTLKEMSRNR